MPYAIVKIRNKNQYKVISPITGHIYSRHTSLRNARAQVRLLNAIEHGYRPY